MGPLSLTMLVSHSVDIYQMWPLYGVDQLLIITHWSIIIIISRLYQLPIMFLLSAIVLSLLCMNRKLVELNFDGYQLKPITHYYLLCVC